MNSWIARNLVYFPVQRFRGQDVRRHMRRVASAERLDLPQILALRDSRVRELARYVCQSVPYYRKVFDDRGLQPAAVSGYDDLVKLPILSKREILDNHRALLSQSFTGRVEERKTSGSTGLTLHFTKDADALAANDAVMWRCYAWYGIGVSDRQVRFWGVPVEAGRRREERLKDLVTNRIRVSAFDISPSACEEQHRRIEAFEPAYFYGYTSAIYGFARACRERGLDLRGLALKAVICTAEKMYPHHRAALEEAFDCPVVDEYGSTENGIIAFQCRGGRMHLMADHLAVEFVDEAGTRVPPGERGRIIVTDLASRAMPLLRYDIGDVGSSAADACACGSPLPLMEIVEGRKEDFIRTKSGTLVHAAYLCYTLKDDSVSEFKMFQKTLESFLVMVVPSGTFSAESQALLEGRLRTALGDEVTFQFQCVEKLPRDPSGKLRYFVSELGNAS